MSANNGPYFIDPELSQASAPDAQMYALADGALQAHQEQHQLAGLVQAATAAADHDVQNGIQARDISLDNTLDSRRVTRKRKRAQEDAEAAEEEEEGPDGPKDSSPHTLSSASALFRRPSKTAKKYTRPPMSKLFSSLELSPENFLQLQSAAKNYMLDPTYPDRQDTVGQRGKGDSELVKLRLWNCVKDFLENKGMGNQYFGPDAPGDEGQPRTMVWPRDKNNIIGAITPLMRRMVTNERQRQYAVETRRSGASIGPGVDSALVRSGTGRGSHAAGAAGGDAQDGEAPKSLFELATGANPKDYIVGETYDWPMLRPHLVVVIQQIGLPEDDLRQIVASISYHLRYTHRGGFSIHSTSCAPSCSNQFVDGLVRTGRLDNWEQLAVTSQGEKRKHMKAVLREVFDIIQSVIAPPKTLEEPAADDSTSVPAAAAESSPAADNSKSENGGNYPPIMLQVSLLQNGQRVTPRRDIQSDTAPYLHSLVQHTLLLVGPMSLGTPTVKALSPEGLVTVDDDAMWQRVMQLAQQTMWMDGEMKVIVEFS